MHMMVSRSSLFCLCLTLTSVLAWLLLVSLAVDRMLPIERSAMDTVLCHSYARAEGDEQPLNDQLSSPKNCFPQQHIMFLKTHKCASTTLQNLFFRFGILRSLVIAVPVTGNYFGHPKLFQAGMVPQLLLTPHGVVDVFAVHSRLNVPQLLKVLHPDSAFVTVVRDPGAQFESLYGYYRFDNFTGHSLENFLKLPLEKKISYKLNDGRIGPNSMLFDLGVEFTINSTALEVQQAIQRIDEAFDLVMIVEKMDESLILLKQILCWEYDDILIFTKNYREESSKVTLSDDGLRKLRELNSGDVHLYDHFLAKHSEAVLQYGRDKMVREVALLKTLRQGAAEDCGSRALEKALNNKFWLREQMGQGDAALSYGVERNLTCWILFQKELPLIENIRNLQNSKR